LDRQNTFNFQKSFLVHESWFPLIIMFGVGTKPRAL